MIQWKNVWQGTISLDMTSDIPLVITRSVWCKEWLTLPLMLRSAAHIETIKKGVHFSQSLAVSTASGGPNFFSTAALLVNLIFRHWQLKYTKTFRSPARSAAPHRTIYTRHHVKFVNKDISLWCSPDFLTSPPSTNYVGTNPHISSGATAFAMEEEWRASNLSYWLTKL